MVATLTKTKQISTNSNEIFPQKSRVKFSHCPTPDPNNLDPQKYYNGWAETEEANLQTLVHQGRLLNSAKIVYKGGRDYKKFIKKYEIPPKEAEQRIKLADIADWVNDQLNLQSNELYRLYTSKGFICLCDISQQFPSNLEKEEIEKWEQQLWKNITRDAKEDYYNEEFFHPFGTTKVEQHYHQFLIENSDLPKRIKEGQGAAISTAHTIELLENLDYLETCLKHDEDQESSGQFESLKQDIYTKIGTNPTDDIVKQVAKQPKQIADTYNSLSVVEPPEIEVDSVIKEGFTLEETQSLSQLAKAEERLDKKIGGVLDAFLDLEKIGDRLFTMTNGTDVNLRDYLKSIEEKIKHPIVKEIKGQTQKGFALQISLVKIDELG